VVENATLQVGKALALESLRHGGLQLGAKLLVTLLATRNTNDLYRRSQLPRCFQASQGGNQFAPGEITARAKDHQLNRVSSESHALDHRPGACVPTSGAVGNDRTGQSICRALAQQTPGARCFAMRSQ